MKLADVREAHESHDETPDLDDCLICRRTFEEFLRYGVANPDPNWTVDDDGYVIEPLTNRGVA